MKHFRDEGSQTVIRVHPVADWEDVSGGFGSRVVSDRKFNTVLAMGPASANTNNFYTLLSFTPYQDIREGAMRVIDLPRPQKLHFSLVPGAPLLSAARRVSLMDDDGVADACSDLAIRSATGARFKQCVSVGVQTDVRVKPHLLDEHRVAAVFRDGGAQTDRLTNNGPCGVRRESVS